VIYRREYESPRFPEMRARIPVLAALLDVLRRRHELSDSGEDRRAARYESPRFPEMRARIPVLAALLDVLRRRHELSDSGEDRRAARRLLRNLAKSLK
jgi:hypothetical protein